MDGVFNQNFMLGFLMAKDRPRDEAISAGLQLSQAPANNAVSVVLVKKQVDKVTELETLNKKQSEEIDALQASIRKLQAGKPAEARPEAGAGNDLKQQINALFETYEVPAGVAANNQDKVRESVSKLGQQILGLIK